MREDTITDKAEDRRRDNTGIWLFFAAFVLWVLASTVPPMLDNDLEGEVGTNREGIECLIDMVAEHRINNRIAHSEDSHHHGYEYEVPDMNIPIEVSNIDEKVCSRWLGVSPESVTTRDAEGPKGD